VQLDSRWWADAAGDDLWEELQEQFQEYREKRGTFAHERWTLELSDDPRRPWRAMTNDPKFRKLAQLALETLTIPTGIAGVERSVSALRRIHTWERNRLAPSRVDKLVFVHQNLRMLPEEKGKERVREKRKRKK